MFHAIVLPAGCISPVKFIWQLVEAIRTVTTVNFTSLVTPCVATTKAMTYSKTLLFNALVSILEERPNTRLSEISQRLRVGRHTLERVVQDIQGCSFTEYFQTVWHNSVGAPLAFTADNRLGINRLMGGCDSILH